MLSKDKHWNKEWNPHSDDKFWWEESSNDSEENFFGDADHHDISVDESDNQMFLAINDISTDNSEEVGPLDSEMRVPALSLTPNCDFDTSRLRHFNRFMNESDVEESPFRGNPRQHYVTEEEEILIPDDAQDHDIDAHDNSVEAKALLNEMIDCDDI